MYLRPYLLGRNKSPWLGASVTVSFPDSTLLVDVDGRWTCNGDRTFKYEGLVSLAVFRCLNRYGFRSLIHEIMSLCIPEEDGP